MKITCDNKGLKKNESGDYVWAGDLVTNGGDLDIDLDDNLDVSDEIDDEIPEGEEESAEDRLADEIFFTED